LTYAEACVAETTKLGRLSATVLISIRSELELPIDEVEYRNVMEEGNRRQAAAMKEFIQAVQAWVDSQPAPAEVRADPKPQS
jgi:hypothetical protein